MQWYSRGLEYALASPDYEQCHDFVFCKDFMQDVIYSTLYNKPIEIYGFKYSPTNDPKPCLDKIRILVANARDSTFRNKIPGCLDLVNQVEDEIGIKRSIVRECWFPPARYNKGGVWLFEGSKRWQHAPPMLSLYTLLLRLGFVHTPGTSYKDTFQQIKSGALKPYQTRDTQQLKQSESGIEKIIRVGDRRIFFRDIRLNYPEKMDLDSIHNDLGVSSFSREIKAQGRTALVPYWHCT